MEVDINEFKARLNHEIALGNRSAAKLIHQEIRLAEDMKASLMEEMSEKTEDFLTSTAARLDTYVFQLQEMEKNLVAFGKLPLDQQTALNDKLVREKIKENLNELEELNPEANPGETDPDPNNI